MPVCLFPSGRKVKLFYTPNTTDLMVGVGGGGGESLPDKYQFSSPIRPLSWLRSLFLCGMG